LISATPQPLFRLPGFQVLSLTHSPKIDVGRNGSYVESRPEVGWVMRITPEVGAGIDMRMRDAIVMRPARWPMPRTSTVVDMTKALKRFPRYAVGIAPQSNESELIRVNAGQCQSHNVSKLG
jgi:hypothetical protein